MAPEGEEENAYPPPSHDIDNDMKHNDGNDDEEEETKKGIVVRYAENMANNPCKHLIIALIISFGLSAVGMVFGEFSVAADNAGWQSRGTQISDRHAQVILVMQNDWNLFNDNDGSVWEELTSNVQGGWETDDDNDDTSSSRRRQRRRNLMKQQNDQQDQEQQRTRKISGSLFDPQIKPSGDDLLLFKGLTHPIPQRDLQSIDECDTSWYGSDQMLGWGTMSALWQVQSSISAIDSSAILALCEAETVTLQNLQDAGHCFGCSSSSSSGNYCLPPYSLVYLARNRVGENGHNLSCAELAVAFQPIQDDVTNELASCATKLKNGFDSSVGWDNFTGCPSDFVPTVVDDAFGEDNKIVTYTSSYFPTYASAETIDGIYDMVGDLDRSDKSVIYGAYEVEQEEMLVRFVDALLIRDMTLAMCSAFVTFTAILIHTRSPWLSFLGLLQIILSFPLAYFVYYFIGGLVFFPFLNFIGVFVVFALGADDIFVAVDKWKNARILNPKGTTVEVAAKALPSAADAMFLTTLTTAVAFFATAICPVAPIKCFAVFCGLLIVFDYIMNIFLVFPALCLYDRWLLGGYHNCCVVFCCSKPSKEDEKEMNNDNDDNDDDTPSLIHRILSGYYHYLHMGRWLLFVACIGAVILSAVFASGLTLPESADVRIVGTHIQYEQHFAWAQNLLSKQLITSGGSRAFIIWGVHPADTGDLNDPNSFTTLELDDSFDPSSEAAQEYMLGFCDRLFAEDFASKTFSDYECPMDKFNKWLQEQSSSTSPESIYTDNCAGVTEIPLPQEQFDDCIIAWSKSVLDTDVLSNDGRVQIILVRAQSLARYDSPYEFLEREWNKFEGWLKNERKTTAPEGVNGMYHSSEDFWWYDTNGQMFATAYTGAAIALACAAAVVFFSSRSLTMTFFAILSIGYVLAATSACLVAFGWELGL